MSTSEREQFEQWAGAQVLDLERYADGYRWGRTQVAWEAWQAARRAQASAEPVATVYTMEALVPGGSVKCHAQMHKALPAGTKLYAAPQPALPSSYTDSQLLTRGDAVRVTFAFSDIDQATEWHARITGKDLGALAREGER